MFATFVTETEVLWLSEVDRLVLPLSLSDVSLVVWLVV
jgi:hypothetical protein